MSTHTHTHTHNQPAVPYFAVSDLQNTECIVPFKSLALSDQEGAIPLRFQSLISFISCDVTMEPTLVGREGGREGGREERERKEEGKTIEGKG